MNNDLNPLIECVPNFSEGQNKLIIDKITSIIDATQGVSLLHVDAGFDANRTVFTFIGSPERVIEAVFQGTKFAVEHINMKTQKGVHPRLGILDVCPLIPLKNITHTELLPYAVALSARLGKELEIPTYLYEYSANQQYKRNLATIRKGEYEGLKVKMQDPLWFADNGVKFNSKTGATVLGVRDFLIAYNVNLNTEDVPIAKRIAERVRESGRKERVNDLKVTIPGSLDGVKAMGWYMQKYQCAQVSTNIVDVKHKGLHDVFEAVKKEASKFNVLVTGSELIGMIPSESAVKSAVFYGLNTTNQVKAIDDLGDILGLKIKLSARVIW